MVHTSMQNQPLVATAYLEPLVIRLSHDVCGLKGFNCSPLRSLKQIWDVWLTSLDGAQRRGGGGDRERMGAEGV